ncbi:ergothioneine biosynthesis protein EgtC [Geitlerinema calcuttense]|uniref:Ergothioneine biosynthesis protein EgtC n=1 Tax=Geitlerinema calcuttense NRMC-F 0142 TaxID=2922238 RepID=A0ABT7LYY0_9CYAN|nr:ergothioneine biosynthesis protein EgtC [Geitlerinema calcuttense]MDL5057203.1 ergothioneine biosynthesis protein EgtC [Geitlerinema calcuttense NRMC-F 0142]
MCRILAYLGAPIQLEALLYEPEHSLVVQSYEPREMTSGVVNADGFGVAWYHPQRETSPFIYKNILPIWSDVNLPELSRYVETSCFMANIRSATAGQAVDLSNCQPFKRDRLLFTHNGLIENFGQTLHRPIRDRLQDSIYQQIQGSTDSEHILALFQETRDSLPNASLETLLHKTLITLTELATPLSIKVSANIILSDGKRLVASRFALNTSAPSLYWLQTPSEISTNTLIASEPLFEAKWERCPENSILSVGEDFETRINPIL